MLEMSLPSIACQTIGHSHRYAVPVLVGRRRRKYLVSRRRLLLTPAHCVSKRLNTISFRFVRSQFDIREKHTCRKDDKIQLINLQHHTGPNAEAKCVAVNQRRSELLAVGANDVYARVYDRRMLTLGQVSSLSFFFLCFAYINFSTYCGHFD